MSSIDRRRFVFYSSGAVLGNFAAQGVAAAADEAAEFSSSGLVTGQVKPLKHKSGIHGKVPWPHRLDCGGGEVGRLS